VGISGAGGEEGDGKPERHWEREGGTSKFSDLGKEVGTLTGLWGVGSRRRRNTEMGAGDGGTRLPKAEPDSKTSRRVDVGKNPWGG